MDLCPVYYEARRRALNNGDFFHLAAFSHRSGKIGINNQNRNTAKFRKRFPNSRETYYEIHAEVDLIRQLHEVPDRIHVARFAKDGTPTMARPCIHCQNFLRHKGVKSVRYTNWSGDWEEMQL
jgi:hypothetical protein